MVTLKNPAVLLVCGALILGGLYVAWRLTATTANLNQEPGSSAEKTAEFTPDGFQLLAVGDIGDCGSENDELVADLAKSFDGRILTLGDTVYNSGTAKELADCFNPAWADMKNRIYPTAGNHDYRTKDAGGYFEYFGQVTEAPGGYYAFEYGGWLLLSLNSNCDNVDCAADSAQAKWLRSKLSQTKTTCQLAYYHHPRFSSGLTHGDSGSVAALWQILTENSVDVALSGHEHLYERFGKLDSSGQPAMPGTRQFVVGTGGRSLYKFASPKPGSEVRDNQHYGLLKLVLNPKDYSWEFIDAKTRKITDFGNDSCS